MASGPNKFPLWVFTCVLIVSPVSMDFSSASPQTEEKLSERLVLRSRRQACAHGTYEHERWTCCLCGAGQQVKTHCTAANQNNGQCKACDLGKYNSDVTGQESCEPCRSCEQPSANLEVAENCTQTRNAKCRCKKAHYCRSGLETCNICYPCKECGSEGVGVACTATNNTVCNAITEVSGVSGGAIAGIVIVILLAIAISVGVALWYRRRGQSYYTHQPSTRTNGNATEVELQPLKDLQIQHVPDIAAVLGWKDMQDVAMRSGMTKVDIDSCKLADPTDPGEQTIQLLSKWVEMEGSGGAEKLIKLLKESRKNDKAEKVAKIL